MKYGNPLIIPMIIVSLLLIGALGFGTWSYMGRQDYKNNVDQKIEEAVEVAEENLSIKKDSEFAESYKKPNVTYKGPSAFGTLAVTYPKTWSNYVEQGNNGQLLNGYMHPSFVTGETDTTNFALRYQVLQKAYDEELKTFESATKNGKVKATAYQSPSQVNARAIRLEGEVEPKKQGVMILIELRDKTIRVWTEGGEFRPDFEEILKNLTFIP